MDSEDSNVCYPFFKDQRRIAKMIGKWLAMKSELFHLDKSIMAFRDFDINVFKSDSDLFGKAAYVTCWLCAKPKIINMQKTNHGNNQCFWNATAFYRHLRSVHSRASSSDSQENKNYVRTLE